MTAIERLGIGNLPPLLPGIKGGAGVVNGDRLGAGDAVGGGGAVDCDWTVQVVDFRMVECDPAVRGVVAESTSVRGSDGRAINCVPKMEACGHSCPVG